jgi:hypothetical protein
MVRSKKKGKLTYYRQSLKKIKIIIKKTDLCEEMMKQRSGIEPETYRSAVYCSTSKLTLLFQLLYNIFFSEIFDTY